eukprot:2250952-Pyramimonas_sp.AAC.1
MPCTGGSPWQYVNEAHYFRIGNHRAMRRLRGIRTCNHWRDPQVKSFLRELGFAKTALHGCACGLKDSK